MANSDLSQSLDESQLDIKQRLNLQTAKIAWKELERFFAAGKAIAVENQLDLIEIAAHIHNDDTAYVQTLMGSGELGLVSPEQALSWHEKDAELWAVVVSPWVLVQEVASV